MEQIGFKNFRKFADFPAMDLAPITILVGENNAGKSTVVKGILALSDFLKNPSFSHHDDLSIFDDRRIRTMKDRMDARKLRNQLWLKSLTFFFNTSYLAHIGTFKRALYYRAVENIITFQTKHDGVTSSFFIKGNPKDAEAVSGNVVRINVSLDRLNIYFQFDLENDNAIVTFNPSKNVLDSNDPQFKKLESYFSSFDKPISIPMNISDYWGLYRGDIVASLVTAVENAINSTIMPSTDINDDSEEASFMRFRRFRRGDKPLTDISPETLEFLKSFSSHFISRSEQKDEEIDIEDRFNPFHFPGNYDRRFYAFDFDIEYLYAHAVTQTVIYSAKDTNDYLSRTIHEYASQKRQAHKENFILKWMDRFGIGSSFKISSVGGEAHIVHIVNKDGKEVNLADKGMGSIQLMVLLFRLAISLPNESTARRFRRVNAENPGSIRSNSIVIIEEPEQNLHPMLQSKLADLFFELNQIGYRFIIETHSEYFVRRTQVIVGENFDTEEKLKNNPFKVYYFPSEGDPYDMVYTTSGLFEKKFGDGFINEAGKLHMAILKNAKKNQ